MKPEGQRLYVRKPFFSPSFWALPHSRRVTPEVYLFSSSCVAVEDESIKNFDPSSPILFFFLSEPSRRSAPHLKGRSLGSCPGRDLGSGSASLLCSVALSLLGAVQTAAAGRPDFSNWHFPSCPHSLHQYSQPERGRPPGRGAEWEREWKKTTQWRGYSGALSPSRVI